MENIFHISHTYKQQLFWSVSTSSYYIPFPLPLSRRIQKLKGNSEVAVGGGDMEEDRYIAPTILKNVKLTDTVMQEEVGTCYYGV